MKTLIKKIQKLKKAEISEKINQRINEFKDINRNSNDELFKELCFCILTANYNAEKTIKIQKEIGDYFLTYSKQQLSEKLKKYGHRFPNNRAEYITEAKKFKDQLEKIIQHPDRNTIREWLVNNIKGLGYKEASHFLRNIGFDDYAIIDFHIIDLLVKHNIIKKPKYISKKIYLGIEGVLKNIARQTDLTLAELDLYLWYMETGKILK